MWFLNSDYKNIDDKFSSKKLFFSILRLLWDLSIIKSLSFIFIKLLKEDYSINILFSFIEYNREEEYLIKLS
jgi:hypothetical protein